MDLTGTLAAIVCSDRYVYIIDVLSGDCVATLNNQSDNVTSLKFSPDCK